MKTEKLYIGEKYLLMVIENYNRMKMLYYQSNDTLAREFEISKQSVSNMISKLIKLGYLKKDFSSNGRRILTYTGKEYERLQFFPYNGKKDQKISQLKTELNKKIKECEYYEQINKVLKEQNEKLMQKVKKST